jgi:hypothetical protein
LEFRQPFGLSSETSLASGPSFADVYVSEAGSEQSTEPVYIGLDSGNRIVQCNPLVFPGLLVLAQSTELRMRTDCAGFAWLELSSGQIRRKQEAGVGTEVFVVHDVPSECSAILRSTPPIVNDVLMLAAGARPQVIACWLMRFFGPQLSPLSTQLSQVQFTEEHPLSLKIHLISDVIVRADSRLSVSGRGTLLVGKHQVQVRRGGALNVTRLAFAHSDTSSAFFIEGTAFFHDTSIANCHATTNVVTEGGMASKGGAMMVMNGGTLEMHHCTLRQNVVREGVECTGGALFVYNSSAVLLKTELRGNVAIGGRQGSYGGAVRLSASSSLQLQRSIFAENAVDGQYSSLYAYGGALHADENSVVEINGTEIVANRARASLLYTDAGAMYVENSRFVLTTSKIHRNVAEDSTMMTSAGAIDLANANAEITDCLLTENVARRSTRYTDAGRVLCSFGGRGRSQWPAFFQNRKPICRAASSARCHLHERRRVHPQDAPLHGLSQHSRYWWYVKMPPSHVDGSARP